MPKTPNDDKSRGLFLRWFFGITFYAILAALLVLYKTKSGSLTLGYTGSLLRGQIYSENANDLIVTTNDDEEEEEVPLANTADLKPKYMLMWTPWMRDPLAKDFFEVNGNSPTWVTKHNEKCILVTSKSLLANASAVVFHSCDFYPLVCDKTLPSIRYQWQRWIFFQIEAASNPNCAPGNDIDKYANYIVYNWTMTYQLRADVYYPYGMLRRRKKKLSVDDRKEIEEKIDKFATSFAKREFDAVWLVSNCVTPSQRERLFDRLVASGLKIEQWGDCGNGPPDAEWHRIGLAQFFTRYRFYLGMENTLCEDYVTEKAYAGYFHNVKHGLIPILYGNGNYSYMFPPGSYINAYEMKLTDVVKLVQEISTWDSKQLAASPYFTWQYTHEIDYLPRKQGDGFYVPHYNHKFGFQSLCDRLWTAERNHEPSKTITDLKAELGKCNSARPFFE